MTTHCLGAARALVASTLSVFFFASAGWSEMGAAAGDAATSPPELHLGLGWDAVTRLSNTEMAELRGGAAGLFFNAFTTLSSSDRNGAETLGAPPPVVTTPGGSVEFVDGPLNSDVHVSTVIGEFRGASGIFQIAQVPGNFNVVNNNLFLQIALINVTDGIPNLADLMGSPGNL